MHKYPTFHREWIDRGLEGDMESVKKVVAAVMSARQSLKLKLRQPVKEVTIFTDDNKVRKAALKLERIILEAANTKSLKCASAKEEKRIENLIGVPNYKIMGPIFKETASQIAEHIRNIAGREIADQMEKEGFYHLELKGKGYQITPDMITFREEMPSGFARGEFDKGRVYVDSQLTKDLIREGLTRDIIRRIQEMRRLMDLPVEAFIDVYIQVSIEDDKKSVQDYDTYLREEIRARNLTVTLPESSKGEDVDFEKTWTIEERTFHIGIKKVEETRINS
jgi:isoleucyl-tRNA synthetase